MKHSFWHNLLIASLLLVVAWAVSPVPTPAHALTISARIADESTEVVGGDRLNFNVDIKYPENTTGRKDLRIEYQILQGQEIIAREQVLRAVDTQASFLDYIVVPKSARGGIHDLNVVITDYENLHEEVSASFIILKGIDQTTTYFFILFGTIVLVGVLVMVQIAVMRRKREV